jgi:hypothetical protein
MNITWSHAVEGYVGCQDLDTIMEHINNTQPSGNTEKKKKKQQQQEIQNANEVN